MTSIASKNIVNKGSQLSLYVVILLLILLLVPHFSNSQNFLNGSFENTTSVGCDYNMDNTIFNSKMDNTVAFGLNYAGWPNLTGEVDIIEAGCLNPSIPDGIKAICLAGLVVDEVSLELDAPLVAGNNYTFTFWGYGSTVSPIGNLEVGLSTVSNDFGSQIYTAVIVADTWVQYTVSFVAPNNGQYVTVRNVANATTNYWNHIDNFTFDNVCNAGWSPMSACSSDSLVDLNTLVTGDAGGTWSGTGVSGNNFDPSYGTQTITYTAPDGCDSSAQIIINASPVITNETSTDNSDCISPNGSITITANGTNYDLFDGSNNLIESNTTGIFNNLSAGDYYVEVSLGGCSVNSSILTISGQALSYTDTINATVCSGDSYTFADGTNQIITSNQTYVSTLSYTTSCDSIITEIITVAQPSVGVYYDTICEGDNYVSPIDDGSFVNVLQSFTYTATLDQPANANGCDSIVTEFITVIPTPTLDFGFDITVCEGEEVTIDLITNSVQAPEWTNGFTGLTTTFIATNDTTLIAEVTTNCGTVSDTISVTVKTLPTIDAGPDQTIPLGATAALEATGAMSYLWEPGHLVDCHDCALTNASTTATTMFVVTGTDENGCKNLDSVTVIIDGEITIFIPNIFSPNNDGENDLFQVYGSQWKRYKMEIYNRWGGLVFESEDPNLNWSGRHYKSDEDCPQGVFVYKFWGVSIVGKTFERAGNVMLAR